jgi:biopolymer transport protein ExbB
VTIGILLPLSITAVAIMVQNFVGTRRGATAPARTLENIRRALQRGDYAGAMRVCTEDRSALAYVIHAGFRRAPEGLAAVRRAMEIAAEERSVALLRTMEYLNLIGHVAPMVGLFGTVNGIIGMFGSIASAGGIPVMSSISHDLGAALVATFWGLLIAIPSLAAFGILRGRLDAFVLECSSAIDRVVGDLQHRPAATVAAS